MNHYTTGVSVTEAAGYSVSVADGYICVAGSKGDEVSVVSSSGIVLYDGTSTGDLKIRVVPGVYMVNVSGSVSKVVVK